MPDLQLPDLEQLYHEAGLRTSKFLRNGRTVTFTDGYYSFADFKREIQAVPMVPIIVATEILKQAAQAAADLLIAAIRLATLDGRGFNHLGEFFVHVGNAIELAFQGTFDFIGSYFSVSFRLGTSLVEVTAALFEHFGAALEALFGYEDTLPGYNVSEGIDLFVYEPVVAPSAPSAPTMEEAVALNRAYRNVYPSLTTAPQSSAGRFGFYSSAPAPRSSLSEVEAELDNIEGLSLEEKTQLRKNMRDSGDYRDDTAYASNYSPAIR